MARPTPTPSFGAGFNAAKFREAIRNTMVMGMPNSSGEKATFVWKVERTFAQEDTRHEPFEWDQTPATEQTHPNVTVPVAVEFSARPAASVETPQGQFDTSRAIITILDVDYQQVIGSDLVLLGGNTYEIEFVGPPLGLFEVTVYQIYATAVDES